MKLIVGCPTRNRTWILEKWREHVENATPGNWDLEYLFVVGDDDKDTIDLLNSWKRTIICYVSEPPLNENRSWGNPDRFHHMTSLRNILLNNVQIEAPDLFLSLDSDILIHQDAIRNMYETLTEGDYAAVGGLTWLDPVDKNCTNIGKWIPEHRSDKNYSSYKRIVNPGTHQVDILMAIKLMSPVAYHIPYEYHRHGEDLGWSANAARMGARLGCDGRAPSKHIMSEEWIARIDKRLRW